MLAYLLIGFVIALLAIIVDIIKRVLGLQDHKKDLDEGVVTAVLLLLVFFWPIVPICLLGSFVTKLLNWIK